MQLLYLYIIACFAFLCSACHKATPDKEIVNSDLVDIEYAKVGSVPLLMDFYAPDKIKPEKPAVIWFTGGGGAFKNRAKDVANLLSAQGYAVFAPNYGLVSSQTPFPSYIHNIKGVIRYVRNNASKYGIDPENIFAGGSSFGGVAASLANITANRIDLEGNVGDNLLVSSKVSGTLDFFGSVYFGRVEGSQTPIEKTEEAFMTLFGCSDINNCPAADSLMVERFIATSNTAAPFLIIHGLDDKLSSPIQSQLIHQKLIQKGISSELILVPDMGHTDDLVSLKLADVIRFIDANLNQTK